MLVEELREIAASYIADYNRLQIASLLQEGVNLTRNKETNGTTGWPIHVSALFDKIRNARENTDKTLLRPSVKHLFEMNPDFYGLLPISILENLGDMLDTDPDVTVPSSQVERLRRRAHSALLSMNNLMGITSALGFEGIGGLENAVTLRISMPVTSARRTLGGVIRLQKDLEDYFEHFSQFTTGETYEPFVNHLSMSDFTIFLEYAKDASVLLQYWSIMMDVAKKTVDFSKSLSGLKNLKSELIEEIRRDERRKIMQELENRLGEVGKIQSEAIRPQFIQSSKTMRDLIAHGLELEVTIRSAPGWRLVVDEADQAEGQASAQMRIASHNEQQLHVGRVEEEQVLLPRPE